MKIGWGDRLEDKQKKERIFRSRPGRRFTIAASFGSLAALFMIISALRHMSGTYGALREMNSIPLFIAGMIVVFLVKLTFDCTGREITVNPQKISYRDGKKLVEIQWRELREVKMRKNRILFFPLSTTMFVGDGVSSFEVLDIAFPEFPLLVKVIRAAVEQSRVQGYKV